MGVGVRSSNYRLRTIWTQEMDRYFIDLMLEQVGKENRKDDQLFSKRAWRQMTLMFNARFNSKYEKEVLKNRHKMLRNLFRALKNLLEQKGFSWDESRQMVTADNRVWDDYIQAHPNARPYRVKTIPYYSDLCELYGNSGLGGKGTFSRQKRDVSQAEGKKVVDDEKLWSNMLEYSTKIGSEVRTGALHDIMIDEDYEMCVAKGMEFMSDIGSTIGARTRTYWQPPMDRYFIYLMLDQVSKGNHVDGLLRKQAWREMISSFNARFGFNYAVDILKNRYKTLRRQYNAIKNLLELDGFAWDGAKEMVVADDCVWQSYIKAHTDARQYMTRPIPYFKDLCLIFRELNGDEKESISSHRNLEMLEQSPAASISSYDQSYKENEPSYSDYNITPTNQKTKRQIETAPTTESYKKSRSDNEEVVHATQEMTTAPSCFEGKNREDENSNVVPVELVVAAIQALPDMDEDLVLDACDFLEDEKKAKTFLALDVKLRKKWLLRKLRPLQKV